MKTKQLIKELMESDPSGELEVCVGNIDIHFIGTESAYYDGALQVLQRDSKGKIAGAKYFREGHKVNLYTMSITDAIFNYGPDDNLQIDYSQLHKETAAKTKQSHDDLRKWHQNLCNKLEYDNFLDWMKIKANNLTADTETINEIAFDFFKNHVSYKDVFPEDGIPQRQNYLEMRQQQWENNFQVVIENGHLKIFSNSTQTSLNTDSQSPALG